MGRDEMSKAMDKLVEAFEAMAARKVSIESVSDCPGRDGEDVNGMLFGGCVYVHEVDGLFHADVSYVDEIGCTDLMELTDAEPEGVLATVELIIDALDNMAD